MNTIPHRRGCLCRGCRSKQRLAQAAYRERTASRKDLVRSRATIRAMQWFRVNQPELWASFLAEAGVAFDEQYLTKTEEEQ